MFSLIDEQKFISKLRDHSSDEIEAAYNHIVKTVLDAINGILKIQVPNIDKPCINLECIKNISDRAMEEENFCHVIEQQGESPCDISGIILR